MLSSQSESSWFVQGRPTSSPLPLQKAPCFSLSRARGISVPSCPPPVLPQIIWSWYQAGRGRVCTFQGFGFSVEGSGYRAQGSGFKVLGFRV